MNDASRGAERFKGVQRGSGPSAGEHQGGFHGGGGLL